MKLIILISLNYNQINLVMRGVRIVGWEICLLSEGVNDYILE
jgi:hypothetical protein